jgi:hypothetical protein
MSSGGESAQPGRQGLGDLGTAARPIEARPNTLVLDDDERRDLVDHETLDQFRMPVGVDSTQVKRLMVAAPLEYLSQEPLCPAPAQSSTAGSVGRSVG